jgi:hypothetical protein
MIFINEWLPNPIGADAKGEFVELFNNGNAPVNLSGWTLAGASKKALALSGFARAHSYAVLRRSATVKFTLKNIDGSIRLYDAQGKLMDQSVFMGSAPEGKSFNRIGYDISTNARAVQQFVWGDPTPGAKNVVAADMGISKINYPTGVSLSHTSFSGVSVLGIALGMGAVTAFVLWYSIKKNEKIYNLFFGRDKKAWQ